MNISEMPQTQCAPPPLPRLPRLTVDEHGLRQMLGYDNGRTESAARLASWRFRKQNNIRTLPGGVYSIAEIENALQPVPTRKQRTV